MLTALLAYGLGGASEDVKILKTINYFSSFNFLLLVLHSILFPPTPSNSQHWKRAKQNVDLNFCQLIKKKPNKPGDWPLLSLLQKAFRRLILLFGFRLLLVSISV